MGKATSKATSGVKDAYQAGGRAAFTATGGSLPESAGQNMAESAASSAPDWANKLQSQQHRQHLREGAAMAAHTLRDGDRPGSGDSPHLKDNDE
jgi:type IV secretion system protein TrbL